MKFAPIAPRSGLPARRPSSRARRAILVATALTLAQPALAAPPPAAAPSVLLMWTSGDATCVPFESIAQAVEQTLGRAVFHSPLPPEASVSGEVGRTAQGSYSAHIVLRGADRSVLRERTLVAADDCHRLDESIAVVITLMVDGLGRETSETSAPPAPPDPPLVPSGLYLTPPRLTAAPLFHPAPMLLEPLSDATLSLGDYPTKNGAPSPSPSELARSADVAPPSGDQAPLAAARPAATRDVPSPPDVRRSPRNAPPRTPTPPVRQSRGLSRTWPSYAVAAGGGGTAMLLSTTTAGMVVRGELAPPGFVPVALAVRSFGPETLLTRGTAGGRFWGWEAEAAVCPAVTWAGAALGLCAGLGMGTLSGWGVGLASAQSHVKPLVFGLVASELRVRVVNHLWVRGDAGLLVPLLKEVWQFRDDATGGYVPVLNIANAAPFGALSIEFRTGP